MGQQAKAHATQQAATEKDSGGFFRRKCACGTHTIGGATCDGCRGEGRKSQRAAVSRAEPATGVQADAHGGLQPARNFQNDLSGVPVSSTRVEGGAREFVTRHRHVLNASVRRVPAAPQNDSTGDGVVEQSSATRSAEQSPQTPAAPTQAETRGPKEGATRYFSDIEPAAAGESQDAIATSLTYTPSVKKDTPPSSPGKFGLTAPVIFVNRSSADAGDKVFNVKLVVDNKITYWVHDGGRTDIASDSDGDITQTNYTKVVSDLTPSPAAVKNATTDLYKNQPPRTKYWAEDLTLKHERFHCADDVKFGSQGAAMARDWLNTKAVSKIEDLDPLIAAARDKVSDKIKLEMALPGSENRAYDDGAPSYTARAQAVKTKGDANGYAAKPPAQQTPTTTPSATPKTPTP
ncbi:MAG TPA: hypothetical protein VM914_08965 [Pyrinomonadaceae bacterium]|jgi:hypothetical protein|nr:hypothetical protein [Pyrinomonadaceae bacterium]